MSMCERVHVSGFCHGIRFQAGLKTIKQKLQRVKKTHLAAILRFFADMPGVIRLLIFVLGAAVVLSTLFMWHSMRVQVEQVNMALQMKESLVHTLDEERYRHTATKDNSLPTIYAITPTYRRPEQIPELTRLSQTLMHVPALHWIICEDANVSSTSLKRFLQQLEIPHTFLLTPMPAEIRNDKKLTYKPKGVAARNAGMRWLSEHNKKGVFYFMDDDNTYDLRLFSEMRWTQKVSMWPVGLVTSLALSSPILQDGRHVGWYDGFIAGRKFPVDMAGFAVNIDFWRASGEPEMPFKTSYEEDGFLKGLKISPSDIEFKASECTKIYVWHTRTSSSSRAKRTIKEARLDNTNIRRLEQHLVVEPAKPNKTESFDEELKNMFVVRN